MKLRNIVVEDAIVTGLQGIKRNEVLAELESSKGAQRFVLTA